MKLTPVALVVASCSVNRLNVDAVPEKVMASLSVETKSGAGQCPGVRALDVLAFRQDTGILDGYGHSESGEVTVSLLCNTLLEVNLVANAPEEKMDGLTDASRYHGTLSEFGENSEDAFVMSSDPSLFTLQADAGLSLPLVRLADKISVKSIIPSFVTPELVALGVRLDRIFLINVSGECYYDHRPSAGNWRNRLEMDETLSGFERKAYCRDFGLDIGDSSALDLSVAFYCYPNPVDNGMDSSVSPDWSPRNTRLVIQMTIAGMKNYYSIDLPSMECNREYIIDKVTLLSYGMESPDIPVSRTSITFETTVSEWEETTVTADVLK